MNIDDLSISIKTESKRAVQSIDTLTNRLKGLSNALNGINSNGLKQLADSLGGISKNTKLFSNSGVRMNSVISNTSRGFNTFSSSANRAVKSSKSLAYYFGKLYANFWLLGRAFRGIGSMISYASSLKEVQNVVDTTFTDMSWKVDEFAKDSIKQFGMSELSVKQYASRFQAMGTAMGISADRIGKANAYLNGVTTRQGADGLTKSYVGLSDSLSDVSLNLTMLTADLASFYDMEQSDVAQDLESIFTGSTRPLMLAA